MNRDDTNIETVKENLSKTEDASQLQRLRKSEERYRTLFETMVLGVVYQDINGKIISVNPAAEEILGLSIDQMEGRTSTDPKWKSIHKDGSNFPGETHPAMVALKTGKKVKNVVMGVFDPKKEETRWININATPQYKKDETKPFQVYTTFEDITKRLEAEESLNKSEHRYYQLFGSMNEGVALHEIIYNSTHEAVDYIITDINQAYEKILGLKRNEVVGKKASELYGTGNPPYMEIYVTVAEKCEPKEFETYFEPMDKYFRISVVSPEKGKFATVFEDITERKKSEMRRQELLENEQELTQELQKLYKELNARNADLQAVLDIAPIVIWIAHDPHCDIITGNRYADKIVMKVPNGGNVSASAKDNAIVSYKVFSNGIELKPEELPNQIAATTGNNVPETGFELVFPDGRKVQLLLSAVPLFDEKGNVRGSLTAGVDITRIKLTENALRKSEERLRLAQTLGDVGVWDWNTVTNELQFTSELEQLYGLNQGTIKSYEDWCQLTHPDDIEKIEAERDEKIATHEPFDLEFRIFHNSGNIHWLSTRGGAIYDKEGKITRILGINTDITQHKKDEESLKESEERYHSLFDNNHAVMLLINPGNGDIVDANPAATYFYGYNYDELVKMNINNINVLSEEEIHDKMQKSVSSQQNHFLFKHRLASGEIRDVDVYSGTYDVGGKKILYSIIHDVTDRIIAQDKLKESNEELQSTTKELQVTNEELYQQEEKLLQIYNELKVSEERFRSIIENIQDAYMRANKEGTIIMASPSAARMYRFNSTQEMIGTSTPSYFKNSEDRDYAIEKLKKHGKFNNFEVEARRNDGTFFWVSQNAQYYYDDQGKIQGSETIVHDITARKVMVTALKKSERSLAEAQHIAHIGSWEWNIKTGDIIWSNELYSIYGLDPNTFIPTLSSFGDYMHPDDEEYVNQHVDQILSENKSHNFDFRIILDDGSIRVLNTLAEVTKFDKNGEPEIIIGINQDITERKEIELKLNENIQKLAQSNKELEQFAYITSHDLREPLRMITSFLQLLEKRYKDQLDQDANEFIGFAVDGAKRLDAMTNDLLQYSKISSEKLEIKPVNFEHVLEEALVNLKVPIEETNAVITHDPLPTINGHEHLKVQLFQNIIGNAIKYRSKKTPKIHISTIKEKNQYIFSIKDNGIGMSPKHLEKIFTIFQRLHTQEEYEGTGIGLAIAQKIVHQQGGQIWVESELGKGSTFYFTVPMKNQNYSK